MSVRSKITIFNAALGRLGLQQVTGGEGSVEWLAMETNYAEIVRAAFESGHFPFGRTRTTLTSRSAGYWGFDDAYQMESDSIHVIDVFLNGTRAGALLESWQVDGSENRLLLNAGTRTVEVEVIREGLEHTWSAKFAQAVQLRLEAVVKDAQEEFGEAQAKDQQADYELLRSGVKASQNRSRGPAVGREGRLTRARIGYLPRRH